MGSWSEYCGLSNVTITSGTKCVFIALKKDNKHSMESERWFPALPPLFGDYNDYGAIENVEDTVGSRLVKQFFGLNAEEFVEMMERRSIGAQDQITTRIPRGFEKWEYMFIHREIWDFMVGYCPDSRYDMGKPWLLKQLGFVCENNERTNDESGKPHRYYQVWRNGEIVVKSDGTWIEGWIYNFDALQAMGVVVPDIFKTTRESQHWRNFDDNVLELLRTEAMMIGLGRSVSTDIMWLRLPNYHKPKKGEKPTGEQKKWAATYKKYGDKFSKIERLYVKMLQNPLKNAEFVDSLCDYSAVFYCMMLYSKTFEPIKRYITPQCGEHKMAQPLFDKFAEVNRSMIYEDDDD